MCDVKIHSCTIIKQPYVQHAYTTNMQERPKKKPIKQ